jgi:hypothetical protein
MPKKHLHINRSRQSKGGTMSESWLQCLVFAGMFSDEVAIRYGDFSFFVPKKSVKAQLSEGTGQVRVRSFSDKGATWAVLPTEYQEIIPVEKEDLIAA